MIENKKKDLAEVIEENSYRVRKKEMKEFISKYPIRYVVIGFYVLVFKFFKVNR